MDKRKVYLPATATEFEIIQAHKLCSLMGFELIFVLEGPCEVYH